MVAQEVQERAVSLEQEVIDWLQKPRPMTVTPFDAVDEVNTSNLFDPALPFGGYKQSGWGRETGMAAAELYTQTKTVAAATHSVRTST